MKAFRLVGLSFSALLLGGGAAAHGATAGRAVAPANPGRSPAVFASPHETPLLGAPAGAGWTRYAAPKLSARRLFLTQGVRIRGGCAYATTLRQSRPGQIVEQDEIASNDRTCREVVQQGTPVRAASLIAAATKYGSGRYKQWYTDCCSIEVSHIWDNINWGYNGSCVVSPFSGGENWGWETTPFTWTVDSISGATLESGGCSSEKVVTAYYNAHGHIPGTSCFAYTSYNNAYVQAHPNGTVSGGSTHSVTGCHPGFSFHTQIG